MFSSRLDDLVMNLLTGFYFQLSITGGFRVKLWIVDPLMQRPLGKQEVENQRKHSNTIRQNLGSWNVKKLAVCKNRCYMIWRHVCEK